jgi:activator of HSP90 ATPase
MKTRDISQSVTFKASPHDIYEALLDSRKHARFTGGKAYISRRVGGKFSAFDGYCEGVNLELVTDKRIMQTWRGDDWPDGHYSRVVYELKEIGEGTLLTFTQTGVPEDLYAEVARGWQDYYWTPLKEMLEK